MSSPDEQQFDFGVTQTPDVVKKTNVAKPPKTKSLEKLAREPQSGESDGADRYEEVALEDDVTRSLKARIERLQRQANPIDSGAARPPVKEGQTAAIPAGREGPDQDQSRVGTGLPESISIAEFYRRLKQAISSQFEGEVWVTGEIRSLKVSNGHRYIELADQGAESKATQVLEIACWKTQWPSVEASLRAANVELEVGQVINVLGKVSIWEAAAKIRFNLSKIDVEALLGGIAAARARLIAALRTEGLLEKNQQHLVAAVPLRIGLVTSQGSQAHQDFVGELSRSGFSFAVELVHSAVQGAEAPEQIVAAMQKLFRLSPDVIVLVRGGGSRNDLAAFDAEMVARAIATSPFPVWVGIGHTGDHSVADEVAHTQFITPTACGEGLVARVGLYWDGVVDRVIHISGLARNRLVGADLYLNQIRPRLRGSVHGQLARYETQRLAGRTRAASAVVHLVRAQQTELHQRRRHLVRSSGAAQQRIAQENRQRESLLSAFDPSRQLARGWAIVSDENGNVLRSVSELMVGATVVARLSDGEAHAVLASVHPNQVEREAKDGTST